MTPRLVMVAAAALAALLQGAPPSPTAAESLGIKANR